MTIMVIAMIIMVRRLPFPLGAIVLVVAAAGYHALQPAASKRAPAAAARPARNAAAYDAIGRGDRSLTTVPVKVDPVVPVSSTSW